MPVKRPGSMSDDERAVAGARRKTPVGVPVLAAAPAAATAAAETYEDFERERDTGVLDAPERAVVRDQRDPLDRIRRIEIKQDDDRKEIKELSKIVHDTRVDVAGMRGQLEVLPELVDLIRSQQENAAQREHVTLTARVDVDRAKQLDEIDARKLKRETIAKLTIGGFAVGGVLIKLLTHWGVL